MTTKTKLNMDHTHHIHHIKKHKGDQFASQVSNVCVFVYVLTWHSRLRRQLTSFCRSLI